MKKALITGITGQDGSYLAEFLLGKGYEVHGLIRRSSTFNTGRIDHLYKDLHDPDARMYLHYGDLSVSAHLTNLLADIKPDEIYHLGAQSHVRVSFDTPEYTGDITGLGTIRLLEAIRKTGVDARFYQASSSEMFGAAPLRRANSHLFSRKAPTPPPRSIHTTWSGTTVTPTTYSPATASSSTTNPRAAARHSSPEKLPVPQPGSSWACRISSTSATWTRRETGDLPAIMYKPCG